MSRPMPWSPRWRPGSRRSSAGCWADFFAAREFELLLRWSGPSGLLTFSVGLADWDFYFLLAGIIGLYAIHRLSLVEERGEIERREMVNEILGETRRTIRNISSVAALRAATDLPASLLRDARARLGRRRGGQSEVLLIKSKIGPGTALPRWIQRR